MRPSDMGVGWEGGGGAVIQTLKNEGGLSLKKNFFRPFGHQLGLKVRGSLLWIRHRSTPVCEEFYWFCE